MKKTKKKIKVEFEGKKYALNLEFSNVLEAYKIFDDEKLIEYEKNIMFIFMLCPKAYKIERAKLGEFIKKVFDEQLSFGNKNALSGGVQTVDFEQDETYIFAAFKQVYGLDLKNDYIEWWEFVSLFQSLPECTKLREIMHIRARPLPISNRNNGAEIQNLLRLKQIYSLSPKLSGESNFEDGMKGLFETLKRRAVS